MCVTMQTTSLTHKCPAVRFALYGRITSSLLKYFLEEANIIRVTKMFSTEKLKPMLKCLLDNDLCPCRGDVIVC